MISNESLVAYLKTIPDASVPAIDRPNDGPFHRPGDFGCLQRQIVAGPASPGVPGVERTDERWTNSCAGDSSTNE